jgi:opacity protein-like surface antigen
MKKFLVAVLIAAIALVPALAQDNTPDAGSLGITATVASNSASFGAIYHVSDVFALRPWLGFTIDTTTDDDKYGYDIKTNNLYFGTDVLYEMKIAQSFLLGLGGQIAYTKYSDTFEYETDDDVETDSYLTLSAIASAQYFFNSVFGIYADLGMGMQKHTYTYKNGAADTDVGYSQTRFCLTTSSLGVVFYVK